MRSGVVVSRPASSGITPFQARGHPMMPIDLETRADVVILPPEPGGAAALPYRDISVVSAIRYVVEELSGDERPRAVVRTPVASLFINEIEALYDQPEFPKAAYPRSKSNYT